MDVSDGIVAWSGRSVHRIVLWIFFIFLEGEEGKTRSWAFEEQGYA
jgi:hypothetical protein